MWDFRLQQFVFLIYVCIYCTNAFLCVDCVVLLSLRWYVCIFVSVRILRVCLCMCVCIFMCVLCAILRESDFYQSSPHYNHSRFPCAIISKKRTKFSRSDKTLRHSSFPKSIRNCHPPSIPSRRPLRSPFSCRRRTSHHRSLHACVFSAILGESSSCFCE